MCFRVLTPSCTGLTSPGSLTPASAQSKRHLRKKKQAGSILRRRRRRNQGKFTSHSNKNIKNTPRYSMYGLQWPTCALDWIRLGWIQCMSYDMHLLGHPAWARCSTVSTLGDFRPQATTGMRRHRWNRRRKRQGRSCGCTPRSDGTPTRSVLYPRSHMESSCLLRPIRPWDVTRGPFVRHPTACDSYSPLP